MNDQIELPTGTSFYANRGIVGVDGEGAVYEGYDGCIREDDFTAADTEALAVLMISRWAAYCPTALAASPEGRALIAAERERAETAEELARILKAMIDFVEHRYRAAEADLAQARSDAKLATALVIERAVKACQGMDPEGDILRLADTDAMADLAALRAERDAAMDTLSALSSYLGCGFGDENTTAEDFDKRILFGIDCQTGPLTKGLDEMRADRDRLAAANQALEAQVGRLKGAGLELKRDMEDRAQVNVDVIAGKEYRIVNAGNSAWTGFCAALAEVQPAARTEGEQP